ncbi:MAG: hypothetical protein VB118_11970 [Oscillospiraceae bacterium]|nr:hypothetical protein [Oscillospiraceae bacterium]
MSDKEAVEYLIQKMKRLNVSPKELPAFQDDFSQVMIKDCEEFGWTDERMIEELVTEGFGL